MDKVHGLGHLFTTVFLFCFANLMVAPAITDVTLGALCPGKDKCSLAIYLSGAQQAIIGLASTMFMPLIGNLSDTYGRKAMLTVPMTLSIFPLVILAYSRTRYYFYAYYVLKILLSMASEGSVQLLALAYVADNVPESRRAAAFGVMLGIASSSFVFGNITTRFLSTPATFQAAASMSVIALLYMRVFLPESEIIIIPAEGGESDCLLEKPQSEKWNLFKTLQPSVHDTICLLTTSPTFTRAAVVAFFINVAEAGQNASLMYYLKAKFHFNKDQFSDLIIISGIAGSISQLIFLPMLTPHMGEEKMLSLGLFSSCAYMVLYSIAWAPWVPYAAAMATVVSALSLPCLRSIVSKQIGPCEQGKAHGCITGICSFASIVSPIAFTPMTALFLSDNAPFRFPGFSIMVPGLVAMMAFVQSVKIKPSASVADNCDRTEALV